MTLKKKTLVILASTAISIPTAFSMGPMDIFQAPQDMMFRWTPTIVETLNLGNAEKGAEIAEKRRCAKCHGDSGIAEDDDTPSLAGQTAAYIYKQLVDYKTGARSERTMKKAAKKLSGSDMAHLGAYYEAQEPEKKMGGEVPALVDKGDRSRLLLACNDCHNETKSFRSMMEIPATLEGQKIEYFKETLMAFQEDDRENDLFGRMRFIAKQLTEDEIDALAKYYAAKPEDEEE